MDCQEFEALLADALGDELIPADQSAFTAHLDTCERCRREFETSQAAIDAMRSLPGPRRVQVEQKGRRLILHDSAPATSSWNRRWTKGGAFRYAAGILIAFLSGYALHAGLMMAESADKDVAIQSTAVVTTEGTEGASFQTALLTAHRRNPKQPDLAKCMIAMFNAQR